MLPPYPAPVSEWHNDTYDAISPTRKELSQRGKTIVITEASQGIGREVAKAFAHAEAKSIHILGRTKQTLEETKSLVKNAYPHVDVFVHVADVVDEHTIKGIASRVGSWDVLVANAGYIPTPELIEGSSTDEWWKSFEINVKGSYVLAKAFLPYKKSGGTIVAYSSGFDFLPPGLPFLHKNSSYSTSKLRMARFYEFLAVENPDLNVFILQPGVVRTALYDKGQLQLDDTIDSVELPAHFTVWLCSSEARSLAGRILFANWDAEELKTKVAARIAQDPVYLTTTFGGFPFVETV